MKMKKGVRPVGTAPLSASFGESRATRLLTLSSQPDA